MKPLLVVSFLAVVFSWKCSTVVKPQLKVLQEGKWEELTTLDGSEPIKRHEAAFIKVDDKFYLLGGRRINPVSIYHTKSNKWTLGAMPPIELHHFQPVAYGKDIYVLGALTGRYPGETPVPNIYIYRTESNVWEKGPQIPTDRLRGGAGAVLKDSKIYMSCGIKDGHRGDHKNWFDVFDIANGEWEVLPDAPRPRDHFQTIVAGNKLYNIAGRTTISDDSPFKNTIGEVDVFDFSTQKWSTLDQNIPTKRAGNMVLGLGDEILVLGGESFSQKKAHQEVEALHIQKHTWSSLPTLPIGRHGTGAIYYENKVFTASGCGNQGGSPELSDLWSFSY